MTDTIPGSPRADDENIQAAIELRRQRPGWVVVWSVPLQQFSAGPLFRAQRGTDLTAQTITELAAPDGPGRAGRLQPSPQITVHRDLAAALRGYRNRWVALQRSRVLTDQDSFSKVVSWLRGNGVKADAVFLVPDDPERLLAGLTG